MVPRTGIEPVTYRLGGGKKEKSQLFEKLAFLIHVEKQ
jgi:hypothetical protein